MAKLSRRNLLAGAVAAPVIAKGHLSSVTLTVSSSPDRLIAAAAEWIAADQHLSAMELRWQDFESRLFAKARQTNESCATAQSSDLPEAQANRRIPWRPSSNWRRLVTCSLPKPAHGAHPGPMPRPDARRQTQSARARESLGVWRLI